MALHAPKRPADRAQCFRGEAHLSIREGGLYPLVRMLQRPHGAATVLFDLTGDARAANQVLRNSLPVVMKNYIKRSTAAGEAGMKLYEHALEAATTQSSE